MGKRTEIKLIKAVIMGRLDKRMKRLGKAVSKEWKEEARNKLSRNVGRYLNSIIDETEGGNIKVTLRGRRSREVEYGTEAYDVKDFLIGPRNVSDSAKTNDKDQSVYLNVPFTMSRTALARELGSGIKKYVAKLPVARIQMSEGGKYKEAPRGADEHRKLYSLALSGKVAKAQKRTLAKLSSRRHRGLMLESYQTTEKGRLVTKTRMVAFRAATRKSGPWMRKPAPAKKIARLVQKRIPHIVNRVLSGRDI